jgi:hypothetical protein
VTNSIRDKNYSAQIFLKESDGIRFSLIDSDFPANSDFPVTYISNFEFLVCKVIFARSQYIQLDNCSQTYWWVQTYAEFIFAILCFLFDVATFYKLVRINRAKKSENDHVESQRRLLERLFLIQVFDPTFHNNILF